MPPMACRLLLLLLFAQYLNAGDWPAIPKEDFSATDPSNPTAPAIILYREIHTYDVA